MNKDKTVRTLYVLLLAAATGGCNERAPAPLEVPTVLAQKVVAGEAPAQASFAGEVRARSESALGFRVGGKITERLVDVGTFVKPGTPLARLDAKPQGRFGTSAYLARETRSCMELTCHHFLCKHRRHLGRRGCAFVASA